MIEVYCDGACSGNPGPGGYGLVIIRDNKIIKFHREFCDYTTNNREELKALIKSIQLIEEMKEINVIIYSDSEYTVKTYNEWMHRDKDGRKNMDLISSLQEYYTTKFFYCQVKKVRGHAQNPGNELADMLATGTRIDKVVDAAESFGFTFDLSCC